MQASVFSTKKAAAITIVTILLTSLLMTLPGRVHAGETISFGVLPVMQALPIFVAVEKGLFTEEGVDVKLIPFRSGLEKDAAMAAGQTQGYFGDMLTSIIFDANQFPVRMVATLYNTTGNQRMFAILAAPGTGKPSLKDLAEKGIAGSSNTVIEYFITKLLEGEAPGAKLNMIEAKNILSRIPMLLEGQVPGAALPEPLVTLVEKRGAIVVADDRGKGIAPTVLTFSKKFLDEYPDDARKFLKAVSRASAIISQDPETVRPIMIKHARIPEPLQSSISIPAFKAPSIPENKLVMDSYNWLERKGVLKKKLEYGQMVAENFLP
jgi:NitT/TauT family transport system substrate-binding protein